MEQYILKAAARFIVPSLATAVLLRVFQMLAWPWWLSLPVAGFVFWV